MTDVVVSVDVAAPAGTTWLALTDWGRQREWMLGTEVRVVSGNGRSVGSRLEAFTGIGGIGVTDTMEITSWEPPVRCTVRHLGKIVRGTGAFHVQERGPQRSVFIWSEQLDLPLGVVGRLGWPLVKPAFVLGLRQSLQRFARFAESYVVGG
ncbi:polyketide cyclase/dehydrase/lipid transport protein [Prauserella shujinwangii]|uniref:Polyketide cyclase/dehydrase/lipid transport protein n=1 Tax=Prauserella shujinwangii TaxID=1453103 RepID=A0A2T0LMF5_9PSEU|nr:SRPBCC family protein [Prauserella shujinwangii]PRX44261.1 polyketide cyclase/dehydrase/lipid transport protein [Prauserella shujinwangii]